MATRFDEVRLRLDALAFLAKAAGKP